MEQVKEIANKQPEPPRDGRVLFAIKAARAQYSAELRARLAARSALSMARAGFTVSSFAHPNARLETRVNTGKSRCNPFILRMLQFP